MQIGSFRREESFDPGLHSTSSLGLARSDLFPSKASDSLWQPAPLLSPLPNPHILPGIYRRNSASRLCTYSQCQHQSARLIQVLKRLHFPVLKIAGV